MNVAENRICPCTAYKIGQKRAIISTTYPCVRDGFNGPNLTAWTHKNWKLEARKHVKKRRKTIYAGRLVKIVEYTPQTPCDSPKQRAARHRATTEAQKILNYRTAQGSLEMKIAANFDDSDYFCTFTFEDGQEPKSRKQANARKQKYIRRLRTQRHRRGQLLKWICSIENKHGAGRYHMHAIINAAAAGSLDEDEIKSLWPWGSVYVSRLFDSDHRFNTYLDIAAYMTKERPEDGKDLTPVGAQIFSCSRGMVRPTVVYSWVQDAESLTIPKDAHILDNNMRVNEYSQYRYIKYMTPRPFVQETL